MLNKLSFYAVYSKPGAESTLEQAVFIKQGFSLPVFLFGMFAALYYRVWYVALALFAYSLLLSIAILQNLLPVYFELALSLPVSLFVAFQFHDWHGAALEERGYALIAVVAGNSEEEARLRVYDQLLAPRRSTALTPFTSPWGAAA